MKDTTIHAEITPKTLNVSELAQFSMYPSAGKQIFTN